MPAMTANSLHPFSRLTPDFLLDAVESLGLRCDGRLLALNSYENRVYQIGIEDGTPLVAKFYRPERWSDAQIQEEHDFAAELAERDIPVVTALAFGCRTLHHYQDFRLALFPRRGGHAPELDDANTLAWLGRLLGRMHAHGAVAPYHLRPTLDLASYGEASLRCVQEQAQLPYDLATPYEQAARQALDEVRRAFDRAGDISWRRVHGDCHVGNILWTQEGPHFVDLDDSCMAPALQDLWMLLSGDRAQQQAQLLELIVGYEDFCDFDRRELHLLEALRTLRLLHYSAWLTRRREDPAFVVAFPWFDTAQYWQERIVELQQQLEAMREAPLCV